nr:unnamed protein product [Digitaria exilis]
MEGGGGDSPNGEVINPVWYGGGVEGFYNREVELNDVVCALCGDGGELLCCEGPCLRSYHTTRTTGHPSGCRSLGFTTAQVQNIGIGHADAEGGGVLVQQQPGVVAAKATWDGGKLLGGQDLVDSSSRTVE